MISDLKTLTKLGKASLELTIMAVYKDNRLAFTAIGSSSRRGVSGRFKSG